MQLSGSSFLHQGLNPHPGQWKHRVLTTGLPGNSLHNRNFKKPISKDSRVSLEKIESNTVSIKRGEKERSQCPLPPQTLPLEITNSNSLSTAFSLLSLPWWTPTHLSVLSVNVTSSEKPSLTTLHSSRAGWARGVSSAVLLSLQVYLCTDLFNIYFLHWTASSTWVGIWSLSCSQLGT